MSDLHDRFERLARRGTHRGADAVLAEARRQAEDSGVVVGVDEPEPSAGVRGIVSPINLEPASSPRKQRRFGALVTAGGVAASLFVGVLAIGSLTGSGGGANSPEGAVRQLADAVSHEDALAAADVLAPEEVRSLKGTVDKAAKKAQELQLAESASAPLTGLDLSVDGLDLSTESLANGYVKVTVVGGTISAHTDNGKFSPLVQRALRGADNGSAQADLSRVAPDDGSLPTFVMTVQRDGHWYVSAAYTALEYVRVANHLPAADFGSGLRAAATLGADSPEAAVDEGVRALSTNDWQKLIALAPPGEIPAYDYRAALTELAADTKPNFLIDKLDTTATVDGDTAKVLLKASGTTVPSEGDEAGTWSVDGSCFVFPVYASSMLSSSNAVVTDSVEPGTTTCGLWAFSILPYVGGAPGNGSTAPITVVRENGRWFISPVGTVLDLVDATIANLTSRTVYFYLNLPDLVPADGVLTLGHPVKLVPSAANLATFAYTYDGHAGDHVLGLAEPTPASTGSYGYFTGVRIYGPDGTELDEAYGLLEGQSVTLPTTGTYKFIIETYEAKETTFTLFDAATAPDAAKHPVYPNPIDRTATPTTIAGSSSSGSSSPSSTSSVPQGASETTIPSSDTTVAGG